MTILSSASKAISKEFCCLPYDTDLSIIHRLLTKNPSILLEKDDGERKYVYAITMHDVITVFRQKMKEQLLINF